MDIHSPSLPKLPESKTEQSLNELLNEKLVLEETLARLNDILERHGVGMYQLLKLVNFNGRYVDAIDRSRRVS